MRYLEGNYINYNNVENFKKILIKHNLQLIYA